MVGKLSIYVPAVPVAQPRPRAVNFGESARIHEVTHIKQADGTRKFHPIAAFKAAVMMATHEAYTGPPLTGPINVSIDFILPRPKNRIWKTKSMPRECHISRPDIDNLIKSVIDAITGIVWIDDSQVSSLDAVKWIADGDESPHVEIIVEFPGVI